VETWDELAQGCKARERNPAHGPGNRVQDPKIWDSQLRYALSQLTPHRHNNHDGAEDEKQRGCSTRAS
jgi:hypothetical protein